MSWGFGGVARRIAESHKELVATSVRFEELRRQTSESLAEFSATLDKMGDRLTTLERECVAAHCDLHSKIIALSERMSFISEKALHAVAFEAVKQATRERLAVMKLESVTSEPHSQT